MATYQRSKLGRFMMIGGLLGAAVSLFDHSTRESVKRGLGATASGGKKLYQTVKTNPSSVTDYVKNTANNVKMTAQEVTQDVIEMADKVNGATKSSRQAYKYVMEAGNELTEITQKIRHTGQGLALGSGTNQLPSTMGSATGTQSSATSTKSGATSTSSYSPSSTTTKSSTTTNYAPSSSTKSTSVTSTKESSTTPITGSTCTSNMKSASSTGANTKMTTSTKTTTTDSKKTTSATDNDYF